jgi:hypothetical protein
MIAAGIYRLCANEIARKCTSQQKKAAGEDNLCDFLFIFVPDLGNETRMIEIETYRPFPETSRSVRLLRHSVGLLSHSVRLLNHSVGLLKLSVGLLNHSVKFPNDSPTSLRGLNISNLVSIIKM